ncbi:MAG: hypothetical protein NVS2B3_08990 [Vulcanimicrobiaceae bacterium]
MVVVDDACPHGSGATVERAFARDPRVTVLHHRENRGVGGAMKTGIDYAIAHDAQVVVKIDADGQMDSTFIPEMLSVLESNRKIGLVKGNRFVSSQVTRVMPLRRLIGNSALTLLVRLVTGYWASVDPTNGFFAIRASALRRVRVSKLADRYYFEISLLATLGMRRIEIAEIGMPAIYGDALSSLSIARVVVTFPLALMRSFLKRLVWQYLIADMNVGSLFIILGLSLTGFSTIFGSLLWAQALRTGIPTTPGTATIVIVPLIIGFQLLLNALLFDVQFASKVLKIDEEDFVTPLAVVRTLAKRNG